MKKIENKSHMPNLLKNLEKNKKSENSYASLWWQKIRKYKI